MQVVEKNMEETVYLTFTVVLTEISSLYIPGDEWYECVCVCVCVCVKSLQSCSTLCDPMNCCLPGSSVYGIFQAVILEWVAMPSSRGSL